MGAPLFAELFLVGFLLNMTWEVWHSQLYTTCLRQEWTKNVRLLTVMSLKDAFFICLFYAIAFFAIDRILTQELPWYAPHVLFFLIAAAFSFFDERIALARRRWEYAPAMPRILGVGVTPLFEIAVTGVLAFYLVSL